MDSMKIAQSVVFCGQSHSVQYISKAKTCYVDKIDACAHNLHEIKCIFILPLQCFFSICSNLSPGDHTSSSVRIWIRN